MIWIKVVFRIVVFGYISLLALLYFLQNKFIFFPTVLEENHSFNFPSPFKEFFLHSKTGHKVNYLIFNSPNPTGVILYFHGNGGALDSWGHAASELAMKTNKDVWIIDYPGYGKSSASLPRSGKELITIGIELLVLIKNQHPEQKHFLYGRSLGSGIASEIAALEQVDGVILETPYVSTMTMAKAMFPIIPTFILKIQLDNRKVARSQAPVLMVHGTSDGVIPHDHAEKLKELLGNKATFISIPQGDHNSLPSFKEYWTGLESYFANF